MSEPPPPPDPVAEGEVWVCGRCRLTLNTYIEYDSDGTITEFQWIHAVPSAAGTHEPEPIRRDFVPGDEIRTKCDFCGEWGTAWDYPCQDFVVEMPSDDQGGWGSRGHWAACDQCHRLIEAGYTERLLKRALRKVPPPRRSVARENIKLLHDKFRLNRLGPAIGTVHRRHPD